MQDKCCLSRVACLVQTINAATFPDGMQGNPSQHHGMIRRFAPLVVAQQIIAEYGRKRIEKERAQRPGPAA